MSSAKSGDWPANVRLVVQQCSQALDAELPAPAGKLMMRYRRGAANLFAKLWSFECLPQLRRAAEIRRLDPIMLAFPNERRIFGQSLSGTAKQG
jgi:hypothetical protein